MANDPLPLAQRAPRVAALERELDELAAKAPRCARHEPDQHASPSDRRLAGRHTLTAQAFRWMLRS